jgi:hypothetical protein
MKLSSDPERKDAHATNAINRRGTDRYACSRPREVQVMARPVFQSYQAAIHNFTRKGIGLIVHHEFEQGAILAIQLRSGATGLSCVLSATVRHRSRLADGSWLIGCSLSRPLSDEEALALL